MEIVSSFIPDLSKVCTKSNKGFYPHPTTVEYFWDQLVDFKKAKGSVQFPTAKALPDELILEMIKYRKKLVSASK